MILTIPCTAKVKPIKARGVLISLFCFIAYHYLVLHQWSILTEGYMLILNLCEHAYVGSCIVFPMILMVPCIAKVKPNKARGVDDDLLRAAENGGLI
jgi:hypothetical protein